MGTRSSGPLGRCAYVAPYCSEESSGLAGSRVAAQDDILAHARLLEQVRCAIGDAFLVRRSADEFQRCFDPAYSDKLSFPERGSIRCLVLSGHILKEVNVTGGANASTRD